ncbi:Mimitin, mitochondrial [Chamberlinius hualienensis]
MAGKRQPRGLVVWIWNNFKDSIIKKRPSGDLVGKDHLGTQYFEIPADPQGGKRKPSRWFTPRDKLAFDQSMPPEWEAWLRGRRSDPPTQDEITANMAIAQTKKIKAKELEEQEQHRRLDAVGPKSDNIPPTAKKDFPSYKEYEIIPGKDKKEDG